VSIGGQTHTLTQRAAGTPLRELWAVGSDDFGQLGDSRLLQRIYPVQIASGVKAVAVGSFHSLYLKTDGTLWAMGDNNAGQLGDEIDLPRSTAVLVATGVAAVAAGDDYSLYVKFDGTLWAMGYNYYGQLGDGRRRIGVRRCKSRRV